MRIGLQFTGVGCVPAPEAERNIERCATLGLPEMGAEPAGPLAVCGGGPSVKDYVEVLRAWKGQVWAINGAWKWCLDNGIDATFITLDPDPCVLAMVEGVKKALLARCVAPCVFDALKDADVKTFRVTPDLLPVPTGGTTATAIPFLALRAGLMPVTFFGCESSYINEQTHAYEFRPNKHWLRIRTADGEVHLTEPPFIMQAENLASTMQMFPALLQEASGGLLRSFLKSGLGWEAVEFSHELNRMLMETKLQEVAS